jgi:hypothetical protein
MIIKPHMKEADFTKVFKDGVEITYSCSEVDSTGAYAIIVKRDKDGNLYKDPDNHFILAKERIENVQVIIGGELI